jgi:hypothetical protein
MIGTRRARYARQAVIAATSASSRS